MAEWFANGRIVELILALVAIEAVALLILHARTGRGPSAVPLACNLAAGASLMLALRASLVGAQWTVMAGWLLAALAAHVGEMVWRLTRNGGEPAIRNVAANEIVSEELRR